MLYIYMEPYGAGTKPFSLGAYVTGPRFSEGSGFFWGVAYLLGLKGPCRPSLQPLESLHIIVGLGVARQAVKL